MSIEEVLTRGVEQVLPSREKLAELMSKQKITLYQGFDPSMPSLHLGNFVGLMKLRQFQKLGHKVIFLVGDFTGMIGDPDKLSTRKMLTHDEVQKNANKWKGQAEKIINFEGDNPVQMLFNSEWNFKLDFKDLIEITSKLTVQQLIERDMFQKRIKEEKPIYLHEFLYPVAQAYDSVHMDVDLEIGGADQLFNMLIGRTLMKALKQKEKYVLTTKLLVDKEGKKAGKTTGNAVFLDSSADDVFGSIMSLPDELIKLGFELLTEVGLSDLDKRISENPMAEKKRLAYEVTKLIYNEKASANARDAFEKTFQKAQPDYDQEIEIEKEQTLVDLVSQVVSSKSEAKRLITQGAVDVNNETTKDTYHKLKGAERIKVGKRTFVKTKLKN